MKNPKFPLGQIVATANASATLSPAEMTGALERHVSGDWGDLDEEDCEANEWALVHGERILSAYHSENQTKFYIITERDRSYTTILLPENY